MRLDFGQGDRTVEFPDDCKDANDVLLRHGKAELRNMIDAATPWPIAGLYDTDHYADAVKSLYQNGAGKGLTTGFACVDELFTVKSGMLHIVTGVPSMSSSRSRPLRSCSSVAERSVP